MDFSNTIELDNMIHSHMKPLPFISKIIIDRYPDYVYEENKMYEKLIDCDTFNYIDDYYWDSIKIEYDWESNKISYDDSDNSSSDSETNDE
jgi:hypothetical protein